MTGEVLLQLESAVRRACLVVSGVPIDETVRITVTVHPGAAASTSADAAVLFDALEAELRGLGGLPRPAACGGRYRGTGGCMADGGAPRDHNVLVAVEDATQNIDQRVVDAFRRFPSHVTVPVVQGRARNVPSPALARNIMLRYRPGQVGDLVPDLLEQARVGSDGFRVFISYRHDDCAQAASDIFHRLAEERFAVFLDRFVGAPGQDFVARIMSELLLVRAARRPSTETQKIAADIVKSVVMQSMKAHR